MASDLMGFLNAEMWDGLSSLPCSAGEGGSMSCFAPILMGNQDPSQAASPNPSPSLFILKVAIPDGVGLIADLLGEP